MEKFMEGRRKDCAKRGRRRRWTGDGSGTRRNDGGTVDEAGLVLADSLLAG